ncbi:MAG: hypothetical protein WC492_01000 [Candidatus Micrarchaeia archaeon]
MSKSKNTLNAVSKLFLLATMGYFSSAKPLNDGIYKDYAPNRQQRDSMLFQLSSMQKPEHSRGLDYYKDVSVQKTNTPQYQQSGILAGNFFGSFWSSVETVAEAVVLGSMALSLYRSARQRVSDVRAVGKEQYASSFFAKYEETLKAATVNNPQIQAGLLDVAKKKGITIEALKDQLWLQTTKNLLFKPAEWSALENAAKTTNDANTTLSSAVVSARLYESVEHHIMDETKNIRAKFNGRGGYSLKTRLPTAFTRALTDVGVESTIYTISARSESLKLVSEMQSFAREVKFVSLYGAELKNLAIGAGDWALKFLEAVYLPSRLEGEKAMNFLATAIAKDGFWAKIASEEKVKTWIDQTYPAKKGEVRDANFYTNHLQNKTVQEELLKNTETNALFLERARPFWNKWGKTVITTMGTVALAAGVYYLVSSISEDSKSEKTVKTPDFKTRKQAQTDSVKTKALLDISKLENFGDILKYVSAYHSYNDMKFLLNASLGKSQPDFVKRANYGSTEQFCFYRFDKSASQLVKDNAKQYQASIFVPVKKPGEPGFSVYFGVQPGSTGMPQIGFQSDGSITWEFGEKATIGKFQAGQFYWASITILPPTAENPRMARIEVFNQNGQRVELENPANGQRVQTLILNTSEEFNRLFNTQDQFIEGVKVMPSVTITNPVQK